jgi:hypothetical protein
MMVSQSSFEHPSDREDEAVDGDEAAYEHEAASEHKAAHEGEAVHGDSAVPFVDNTSQVQIQSIHGQNDSLMGNEKKHPNQNPKHTRFGTSQLDFLKPWWIEISACVLVLLAIIAIVLTLAIHHNQPLPNWPFGVSVSSPVSVFVVILKGGMLLILGEGSTPNTLLAIGL